jgi:Tol biopolymer transport system component
VTAAGAGDQGSAGGRPHGARLCLLLGVGLTACIVARPQVAARAEAPALSGEIVFERVEPKTGTIAIWLVNADGSNQRRVTGTVLDNTGPAWSPDGTEIAFARNDGGTFQLFTIEPTSGGLKQLTTGPRDKYEPIWARDGERITYSSGPLRQSTLTRLDVKTKRSQAIATQAGTTGNPALSPTGAIAFASKVKGDSEIVVVGSQGGNRRTLTENSVADLDPDWSPDGKRIAFTRDRDGNYDIYVKEVATDKVTRLTTNPAEDAEPSWSSDGQHIAFVSTRSGNYDVFVMNADGSNQTNLTRDPRTDLAPDWQAMRRILARRTSSRQAQAVAQVGCGKQSGNARDNKLIGTPAADTICGFGGADTIKGMGGNDLILGGDGKDTIIGGPGRDMIAGGAGKDILRGKKGRDKIFARDHAADVVDGGNGTDLARTDPDGAEKSITSVEPPPI